MAYTTPEHVERARKLRKSDTAAEQKLWEALRSRRLNGMKFVRQLSIGPYFADFACRARMLIVEVDGATHGSDAEVAYDAVRTGILEREGWKVLRAWNHDVFTNLDGVLETILLAAADR
jgi:very-short-patch-repair endonuclease